MIEMIRQLTRSARSLEASADEAELYAARQCLQNTLHVLERTLQSMECSVAESLSDNGLVRN